MKLFYQVLTLCMIALYTIYICHLFRIGHPQPLILHALVAAVLTALLFIRKRTPNHRS